MTPQLLEDIVAPNIDNLIIEDDTPLDNFQTEKQQRLLVEPLYSSWKKNEPFIAAANVGIFSSDQEEGIAPDMFLSLGVSMPTDWSQKQNRSYLVWRFGKFPEVVIEIVSNRKGNELVRKDPEKPTKKEAYARMGIAYYVVFDPLQQIQDPHQMDGHILKVFELTGKHYTELSAPFWLQDVGLGLTLWDGEFEAASSHWLRWCNHDEQLILTGAERADLEQQGRETERQQKELERQRADAEQQRADRLADRLRELGINPDEI